MFKFHCPHCQQRIAALEEEVGIVGTCPSCDHAFTIPAPAPPEPEPAPEPAPEPEPEPETEVAPMPPPPLAQASVFVPVPPLELESSAPSEPQIVSPLAAEVVDTPEPETTAPPEADGNLPSEPAGNLPEPAGETASPSASSPVEPVEHEPAPSTPQATPSDKADTSPSSAPSDSEPAEPLAPLQAILAALGFNAALAFGLFSLWAEWGPYAWVASLQFHFFGQHLPAVTFILTIVLCGFPTLVLYHLAANGGRLASILAHGIVGLALTAHFAATVYFLITAASPRESTALASAAQGATFLPHPVSLTPDYLLLLNQQHIDGLAAPSTAKDPRLHIPFYPSQWANETTPVILSVTKSSLESQKTKPRNIVGTIRKRPLPYLARRSVSTPLFCVILTEHESVRAPWIVSIILYAGLGIYALQRRLRSGRETRRGIIMKTE